MEIHLTREVEELIEEECFKSVTLLSNPLTLDKEIVGLNICENISVSLLPTSPPLPMPRRIEVDLLIDPVSLGWYRSLHVLRRVVEFKSNV